jgi:hypothetical protein
MPNLKIAAFTATALVGSTMLIGTAAGMPLNGLPQASKQVTANVQDVGYQPERWRRGAGWRHWGPWGWRHRWSSAKQSAKDRAD